MFLGVADILGDWLHRQLHWSCIPRAVHAAVCNRIHNPHKRHKCLAICDLSMWQWWGGPGWQHATYMRLGCRDALWPCIDEDRRGSMKPREWGFASWSKSTAMKIPRSERTRSLETRNDINVYLLQIPRFCQRVSTACSVTCNARIRSSVRTSHLMDSYSKNFRTWN